jgi:hypothetical protein
MMKYWSDVRHLRNLDSYPHYVMTCDEEDNEKEHVYIQMWRPRDGNDTHPAIVVDKVLGNDGSEEGTTLLLEQDRLDTVNRMVTKIPANGFIMMSEPEVAVTSFRTDEFDLVTNALRRIAEEQGWFLN